jgi:hypothetical protein
MWSKAACEPDRRVETTANKKMDRQVVSTVMVDAGMVGAGPPTTAAGSWMAKGVDGRAAPTMRRGYGRHSSMAGRLSTGMELAMTNGWMRTLSRHIELLRAPLEKPPAPLCG